MQGDELGDVEYPLDGAGWERRQRAERAVPGTGEEAGG
jgi:hypothetical protein